VSERYPGGIITKSPATPTGPYQNGTAYGVWTLDQQLQYQQQGIWPTAGLLPNYIEDVFSTYLYTGNATARSIVNNIDISGNGGLVWTKSRSLTGSDHFFVDTDRGATKFLNSNNPAAQVSTSDITAFNSTGYSLNADVNGGFNNNGATFASWTFRKQAKFFDVVTYTGNGVDGRTITHNLGASPGFVIVKRTDTTGNWVCLFVDNGPVYAANLLLNSTAAAYNSGQNSGRIGSPTSTTFATYLSGGSLADVNASGGTYVAYLFASNAGGFGNAGTDNVITCGSYTGVTYPNSLEVTLGFEPQFVIIKNSNTASGWTMWDTMRGMSVVPAANTAQSLLLEPNTSAAESNQPGIFPTATGFVVKNGLTSISSPSDKMIYIAIRRGPMATPTDATKVYYGLTRTGTGANATVTSSISPVDMVWSFASVGGLGQSTLDFDRLRGSLNGIYTATTSAEYSLPDTLTGFDIQNGYKLGSDSSGYGINYSGISFINYNFKRAPGFFDEVCYTGTGSATTQAHNLGVAPEMLIVKSRSVGYSWGVLANTAGLSGIVGLLNDNQDFGTGFYAGYFNSTLPTSSVFSIGSNVTTNGSGSTYVAYLFATVAGVSKVGTFTGTGGTQTVNCGFGAGGARWLLVKRTDAYGNWYVFDSARGFTSSSSPYFLINSTAAQVTGNNGCYAASTGFTVTSTASATVNINGASYIYVSVA
jgi:hypothetical protein